MRHPLCLVALTLLAACGGGDEADEDACYFDGRYSMSFAPRSAECPTTTFPPLPLSGEQPCAQSQQGVTPTGVIYDLFVSCDPGDPVVECLGIANFENGCSYDVALRRVAGS